MKESSTRSSRRELVFSRAILMITSLALVAPAVVGWWNGVPPLGDDASSHIVMMARVGEALRTGAGWWAPDFNLGFPIGLYYQPLPHFVGGVLTALLGGGTAAIGVYKGLSVLMLALLPWGVALGARFLGFRPSAAAVSGVAAPLVLSTLEFGLTVRSGLILALHTQAWAAVLLPIALGQVARALDGRRGAAAWAIGTWALVFLCHFFYGVAVLAVALFWVPCRPRDVLGRLGRLALVGGATAACLLFWFVPLVTSLEAMGGWPFGSATRTDGYGFEGFLLPLLGGHLLDGETRPPILSLAAAAGVILCFAVGERRDMGSLWARLRTAGLGLAIALGASRVLRRLLLLEDWKALLLLGLVLGVLFAVLAVLFRLRFVPETLPPRLLLAMVLISALFSIGRAGLGPVVDVFFFNRAVQMFRYLGVFHLAAVWLVGWGVGALLARFREHGVGRWLVPALLVLLVVPTARWAGSDVVQAFRTIDDADVDLEQYQSLVDAMRQATEETGAGRIFVHPRSGLHGHFHSGLLALWDASDAGESYGIGLHDSLNFYYLEFFHPERERDAALMDLYGFQYIAGDSQRDFSRIGAEQVLATPRYTYWRLGHRVPLCGPIDVASTVRGYPRARRRTARAWLNGNGPRIRDHMFLDIPSGVAIGHSTDAPVDVDAVFEFPPPRGPAGHLVMDQRSPDRLLCRVSMERSGAVLFRVGYHPFWRAWVDGQPAEVSYAFPAFAAVEVGPGLHEVIIRYRLPRSVHPLLLLAILVPAVAWFFGRGEGGK